MGECQCASAAIERVTAGNLAAPLAVAGSMIRYGFYLVGMLVLGLIGLGIMALWKIPPKAVNAPPAFRIVASGLEQLAVTGSVTTSSLIGRAEVRQYGRLSNRGTDLAVAMVLPPGGSAWAMSWCRTCAVSIRWA